MKVTFLENVTNPSSRKHFLIFQYLQSSSCEKQTFDLVALIFDRLN